jgi:potassium-transporting ATPase potassium-binding subunit
MSGSSILLFVLFLVIVTFLVKPLGAYMAHVFSGQSTWPDRLLRSVEGAIYRLARVDPAHEMNWAEYLFAFVRFSVIVAVLIYVILRLQSDLPWFDSERMLTPMTQDLARSTPP